MKLEDYNLEDLGDFSYLLKSVEEEFSSTKKASQRTCEIIKEFGAIIDLIKGNDFGNENQINLHKYLVRIKKERNVKKEFSEDHKKIVSDTASSIIKKLEDSKDKQRQVFFSDLYKTFRLKGVEAGKKTVIDYFGKCLEGIANANDLNISVHKKTLRRPRESSITGNPYPDELVHKVSRAFVIDMK